MWIAEIVLAALANAMLFPMLLLYSLDAAAGTIAPDAAWALGYLAALVGIWLALLVPVPLYQRKPAIRWLVVAALAVAVPLLPTLAWGSVRTDSAASMWSLSFLLPIAAAGVAVHQLIRLLRVKPDAVH